MANQTRHLPSTEPGYTAGRLVYSPLERAHEDIDWPLDSSFLQELYDLRDSLRSYGMEQYGSGLTMRRTTTTRS